MKYMNMFLILNRNLMIKNKKYLKMALTLLVIGIIFIFYALNHPEASFPWSNNITYIIYIVYLLLIVYFASKKN